MNLTGFPRCFLSVCDAKNTLSWISMGFPYLSASDLFIVASAGAYTHNISISCPIVGADQRKLHRWQRDWKYLLVNCSGTEITKKEGHHSLNLCGFPVSSYVILDLCLYSQYLSPVLRVWSNAQPIGPAFCNYIFANSLIFFSLFS